ncbi:uncharacterized protein L969DRAFT_50689 [Mixia osmundae IAM 14324]|uniref:uncharacterized protein n=1 Tax=Mixia osmundae (strain CBS 9802 / IAM 14324 / JCM 22182 / KY 12970) TaxID=764103 RepID=UPI0004A54748|nr:uncharacterized protein L969DRAFT_51399 [Mixia osmundae IAM 14324]XP_014566895.1 uncharacterized protein L969DRAFT_50689 [Mixia osmundae IAM 14324]KEI38305.1 hypothetical protein L969DRAFT_51399 [Mixia osmundae IAM 14324]KEI38307.1 hypothetical protein L969DRAFT_50689 [Mixia osmundae IAM 14324]
MSPAPITVEVESVAAPPFAMYRGCTIAQTEEVATDARDPPFAMYRGCTIAQSEETSDARDPPFGQSAHTLPAISRFRLKHLLVT